MSEHIYYVHNKEMINTDILIFFRSIRVNEI